VWEAYLAALAYNRLYWHNVLGTVRWMRAEQHSCRIGYLLANVRRS
jgi:hypothetical protein